MKFYVYPVAESFSSHLLVLYLSSNKPSGKQFILIEGIPAAIPHPKNRLQKDINMPGLGVL